uniref:PABS domain-containing protein n=1 Tax=Anopheles coluzzii TaxID=1518534 RepID=A0A8W7P129_ANOCL
LAAGCRTERATSVCLLRVFSVCVCHPEEKKSVPSDEPFRVVFRNFQRTLARPVLLGQGEAGAARGTLQVSRHQDHPEVCVYVDASSTLPFVPPKTCAFLGPLFPPLFSPIASFLPSESHGVVLILDGIIQCTERDEFAYQEMISFLPLCCHPNPQRVLIVGGGDDGVAREVAKHPAVLEVHQVEIDERVVELSKQYLPFMACGFESPKLKLTIGDGFEYMKQHEGAFDVIITDSSDPIGPAESLFRESYFELVKRALKPNGIICSQGGSFWLDAGHVRETLDYCRKHFPRVTYGLAAVPSYPTGQIGFFIASLNPETEFREPARQFEDAEIDQLGLRYYTTDVHRAAFTLPRFAAKALNP